MDRIADELAGIRAALETANASDPLAILGAALEAGVGEDAPERVKLEPKVHRIGGGKQMATVPLAPIGLVGWSIDISVNDGNIRFAIVGPYGRVVETWEPNLGQPTH